MIVRFQRSGGFAGVFRGCQLDTENMPDQEARHLEGLVAASGVMSMTDKRVPGARDVHLYSLEIESGGQKKSLAIDQISVPAPARELFAYLVSQSELTSL